MGINANTLTLLSLMSDGCYHSGEALGEALGVSRAAVWKLLGSLPDLGVEVQRKRGQGYCLVGGLDLLEREAVLAFCGDATSCSLDELLVLPVIDSTNKYLLERIQAERVSKVACLAEMQTAGKGRRGRQWQSPFARNIYLSICWPFESGIAAMEGLSLAVGVAVAQALEALACPGVALKWPNDILIDKAKLGGVLIEIAGNVDDCCYAVIGVGLNVDMPSDFMADVDQPWADFHAFDAEMPCRNRIAGTLIQHLTALLASYESEGFGKYRDQWQERNAYRDQQVRLITPSGFIEGVMLGVDSGGALRLAVDGVEKQYIGGELSLRGVV